MNARALVLNNRDSFVFNLVDDLERAGTDCTVVRSDMDLETLDALISTLDPRFVVLSPGPGCPEDHTVLMPFLRASPKLPVLGVCLGMQAMVTALNGRVERNPKGPVHGRSGRVLHAGDRLFRDVPSGFLAGRYHSLCATELPSELEEIAWTEDRATTLAVRHRSLPWIGLQFHPESFLTPLGRRVVTNFMEER